MSEGFDYRRMVHEASMGVLRRVLEQVSKTGLPGEHHLYVTFSTVAPGVRIAPSLLATYPETMTIVLQNQFWDLAAGLDAFAVTLRFGGALERIHVPYAAITTFIDPSVPFGLDLAPFGGGGAAELPELASPATIEAAGAPESGSDSAAERPPEPPREPPAGGGELLPFRRRE